MELVELEKYSKWVGIVGFLLFANSHRSVSWVEGIVMGLLTFITVHEAEGSKWEIIAILSRRRSPSLPSFNPLRFRQATYGLVSRHRIPFIQVT